MGKINLARVILGGLLAGLILNIFEYVLNGVVLEGDLRLPPLLGLLTGSSPTRFQTQTASPPTWPRGASHSLSVSFCLSACSSPPFAALGSTKSKPNP